MRKFKKWAFLVGISKYEEKEFPNIEHTIDHVIKLKDILDNSNEFEEIVVLTTDDTVPKDEWPTEAKIRKQFKRFFKKKVKHHDLVIVYFSCHGGEVNNEICIFPYNASKEDSDEIVRYSIPISFFKVICKNKFRFNLKKVFLFFDICQKVTKPRSHSLEAEEREYKSFLEKTEVRPKYIEPEIQRDEINQEDCGANFLFACQPRKKALVKKIGTGDQSIFSYALLRGLGGRLQDPLTFGKFVE